MRSRRPHTRREPLWFALLLTLLLTASSSLLSGCGSSASAGAKVLRIPLVGAPGVPDPARASSPSSRFLSSLLYSGLVKFGPDLHVVPELAVSIPTVSADGRTYTFSLRQDARFADDRQVTAADVAYSLTRALSPMTHSTLARRYLSGITGARAVEAGRANRLAGVQVVDDLTIRIHLTRPDASFLEKLALPVASVVDPRVIGDYSQGRWVGNPAGSGPWMITSRDRDGTLELGPRPHYYGSDLQLQSLLLVPVASEAQALDLYRRDSLDVAPVPLQQYEQLSDRSDFEESPSLDAYYAMPAGGGGLPLAAQLDRDLLLQDAFPELSPLDAIVPSAVPDYNASPPTLDSAGAPTTAAPGADIKPVTSRDPIASALGRALSRQWHGSRHAAPTVHVVHETSLLPDPSVWLRAVLPQTRSHWFRAILARSDELTGDPITRMNGYSQIEDWALQTGLIIPLASGNLAYLIKPTVENVQVTSLGIMPENNDWSTASVT